MAAYARQGRHWSNQELVETGLALTEVGDRDQFYGKSQRMFTLGIAWQILTAWFSGPAKDKAT